jgi:hypothetical protein
MASLSLVGSASPEVIELGSKEWADKTRQETKALADNIERNYLQLAENLWELFDRPVDNDRKKTNWLTCWKYVNIGDYAEKELGIHRRIAERLRRIWAVVKIDCALDQSYLDRFTKIGRSKARLLCRAGVMNAANAKSWIDRAEKLTYLGLEAEVNTFLMGREGVMKGTLGPVERVDADGDVLEDEDALAEAPASPVLQGKTLWQLTKEEVTSQVNEAAGKSLEPEEKATPKHFSLFPDQMDTVKAALERAGELSGSSKDGQNLSLICLDFLATNEFKTASLEQTQRFFKRIETALEVKLVVLSQKDHEILYGYKVLEKINNS